MQRLKRLGWVMMLVGALALLEASVCTRAHASADPKPPKTDTSGLAFSAGLGTQYGFVGAQVAYYLQRPASLLRVVPYASIGPLPCYDAGRICHVGGAAGIFGSYGRAHRLLLDVAAATTNIVALQPHGDQVAEHVCWGALIAVGYEYMAAGGFFLRGDLGVSYAFAPSLISVADSFGPAITLIGFGYKLW